MTTKRARSGSVRILLGTPVLWALLCLWLVPACSDEGTTTKCDDMPVDGDPAKLQAWWDKAVDDGCATAEHPPQFVGAAGARP